MLYAFDSKGGKTASIGELLPAAWKKAQEAKARKS